MKTTGRKCRVCNPCAANTGFMCGLCVDKDAAAYRSRNPAWNEDEDAPRDPNVGPDDYLGD